MGEIAIHEQQHLYILSVQKTPIHLDGGVVIHEDLHISLNGPENIFLGL